MTLNKCLDAITRRSGGRFTDVNVDDVLMALLFEPECRDHRRWRDVFDHIRAEPAQDDVTSFIARAIGERVDRLPPAP